MGWWLGWLVGGLVAWFVGGLRAARSKVFFEDSLREEVQSGVGTTPLGRVGWMGW